jgi:LysM repeat protein
MAPRSKARFKWGYLVAALLVLGVVVALRVALRREPDRMVPRASPTSATPTLTSTATPAEPTRTRTSTPGQPTPTVIPTLGKTHSTPTPTNSPTARSDQTTRYIVRQGDTLVSIAETFGVTTQAIALANGVQPGQIQAGQTLTIPAPDSTTKRSSHLPDWREREWRPIEVDAIAQADTITVFLASIADWPAEVNATHWGDLQIQVE